MRFFILLFLLGSEDLLAGNSRNMYQFLRLLCAGDSQVLGIDVQLLEHIHKQKYSAR